MDRYKMLPSYHYEDNTDGNIQNPATDKVRTCTISGNHGRNLIPFPYIGKAGTQNGVTITINSDGVITLNGTATASVYFGLLTVTQAITNPGKYTISGAPGIAGVSVQCKVDGAWTGASVDTGNGATFTVTQQIDQITVQINKGTVCDNVVVKPMLEEGETKTEFEPWRGVGDETKNILPYPYANTTKTVNGITFTDNGDGSVTVNGTATDKASFFFNSLHSFPPGKYYLCGAIRGENMQMTTQAKVDGVWDYTKYYDYGSGVIFTVSSTMTEILLTIRPNSVCENVLIKPMLVDLNTQNLIPYPYARTTQTINGITFTDNKDGTITVNGTATDTAWYPFSTLSKSTVYATEGIFHLSGCPSGGNAATKYNMGANVFNDETQVFAFDEIGNGRTVDLNSYTFTSISVNFTVRKGVTVNNLTFRPLLVKMDDISSYEPYGYKIPIKNQSDITNLYLPKQIMQGESATFNEPFKLSKANKLSVETAVKPSAVKYTYYTY